MTHVIRAASLRGYVEVMQELGFAPCALLRKFDIKAASFNDDDALLPMDSACRLLEESSQKTRCPDFGLRIASYQDHSVLGVLGLVMMNASSPADVSSIVSRFIFVQGTALRIDVKSSSHLIPNTVAINLAIDGIPKIQQRQMIDLILGMSFQAGQLRDPFARKIRAVSLPHKLGRTIGRYRAFFGHPVYENQPHAALHCDAEGWAKPVEGAAPHVSKHVHEQLEKRFPVASQRLGDRVRLALRPLIGTPQATREEVARILAIHTRTLHRRLLAEGTSFQEIKDTMRRELALKYLTETDATLAQVAALLGFTEQSALSRACRKWFDKSPSDIRQGRGTAT